MKSGAGFGFKALLAVMSMAGLGLASAVGLADGSSQKATTSQRPAAGSIQPVATPVVAEQGNADGAPQPWVLLLAGGAVVAWVALRRSTAR